MVRTQLAFIAVASLLVLASGCAKEWEPYSSASGRFKVDMPGAPEVQSTPVDTDEGTSTVTQHIWETNAGNRAFAVTYCNYPESYGEVDAEEVLDLMTDGLAQDLQFTIDSQLPVEVEGGAGREFSGKVNVEGEEMIVKGRIFLIGSRVYELFVVCVPRLSGNDEETRFFTSFEITK